MVAWYVLSFVSNGAQGQENIHNNVFYREKKSTHFFSPNPTFAATILIILSELACPSNWSDILKPTQLVSKLLHLLSLLFPGTQVLSFPPGHSNLFCNPVFLRVGSCLDFMGAAWKLPSSTYGLGFFHACTSQIQTPRWPCWDPFLDTIVFCWSAPPAGLESSPSPMATSTYSSCGPVQGHVQSQVLTLLSAFCLNASWVLVYKSSSLAMGFTSRVWP